MGISKERRDAIRAELEYWGGNLCDISGADILALLDALDAEGEPVAVKLLEWSAGHSAKSPCGTFYIVPVNGKFGASLNAMTIIAEHLGFFETMEDAKSGCQADYEARIRSALYTRPITAIASQAAEIERLREALKPFADYMDGGMDCNHIGDQLPDADGVGWVYLTYGDFRRARAALNGRTP